jgi:predicted dehydrogenase
MGQNHARIYKELSVTELVGVADVDEKLVRQIGEFYRAATFTDYRRLLEYAKPDVVSVVVPTALHEEVALAAMAAGAHVLVEKPIAHNVAAGKRMVEVATKHGRQLMVGHIVRFNPALNLLKQKLAAGELGRIYQIVCQRTGPFPSRIRDVGVVVDLATHDLDIMRYLLDSEVDYVFAETQRQIHTTQEDLVAALLHFQNGVTGMLEINWLTPTKVREIRVLGEYGMFRVDDLTQDLYYYENGQTNGDLWQGLESLKGVSEGQMIRYAIGRQEPLKAELSSFISSIINGNEVPVNGDDGIEALRLALALVESGRKRQCIEV